MKKSDRAWLAGLLEGEGYFGWNTNNRGHRVPVMDVVSTDCDVMARVASLTGANLLGPYGPYGPNRDRKQQHYKVQWYGRDAIRVIGLVRPWLFSRRAARADAMLQWKYHKMGNNKVTGRLEVVA